MGDMKPRPRPCPSCPYRQDVPSGIWSVEEYDKLPLYDLETGAQAEVGAIRLFACHGNHDQLCAGWVGCHDMDQNIAIRIFHERVDLDAVYAYVSPVPLFNSGAEAAEHGKRDLECPGARAGRMQATLNRRLR